ncbi:V-type ATP synthase subunit D [Nocardia africana]|uniref:V-type ATP synthase subunit D n=1 Tax=Nocardia africana TaxID=134964 RepID=A0ABW6NR61_9NOCA
MAALPVPPGRAGRVWLRGRLEAAVTAVTLLEQKQALLEREHRTLLARCEATRADWIAASETARVWYERAALSGGRQPLTLATPAQPCDVTVTAKTVVGVRYPVSAECAFPQAEADTVVIGAAVPTASEAARDAIRAAASNATAVAAARLVEHELAATRVRLRALRHRRIPQLRSALATLELSLEERERAEQIPFLLRPDLRGH